MMNQALKRLSTSAFVLAMALAVATPLPAGAKPGGHGNQGRGNSAHARGGNFEARGHGRGGGKPAFEVRRDRETRTVYAPEVRYRDSGTRYRAPSYRTQTRDRYVESRPSYRYRTYYTSGYYRPRYHYHSGFSLGVFIGVVPSYGFRYFDPYCDIGFRSLDSYYDHCHYHGHPDVIQVISIRSGYPIASCAYRGGDWVVDDCY